LIHTSEKILLKLPLSILVIVINDTSQCENVDHVNVIFKIGPWATYVVLEGDLVLVGTTLVTIA